MKLENRKAGKREGRPTPETATLVKAKKANRVIEQARRLVSQRDEALAHLGAKTGHDCVICGQAIFGTLIGAGDGAGQQFAHPACYYRRQNDRLLGAINLALRTNGGPIYSGETVGGEAYVMVKAGAFAGLEAAAISSGGGSAS